MSKEAFLSHMPPVTEIQVLPVPESIPTSDLLLSYLPPSEIRMNKIGENNPLLPIAAHEGNHGIYGMLTGKTVYGIDLNPGSDGSLARCFMDVDPGAAGAGGVQTPFGSAFGTSGDRLATWLMGASWESSVNTAEKVLSKIPMEVRKNFAEMVTFVHMEKGYIPGSLLPLLLERSFQEYWLEQEGVNVAALWLGQVEINEKKEVFYQRNEFAQTIPDQYVIDELINEQGERIIQTVENDVIIEQHSVCSCGGKDENHTPQCEVNGQTSENQIFQENTIVYEQSASNTILREDISNISDVEIDQLMKQFPSEKAFWEAIIQRLKFVSEVSKEKFFLNFNRPRNPANFSSN